ncbi:MAG: endonuclease-8, partial [Gammaproteobacteria bacterium]
MPEGPEIRRAATQLDKVLRGNRIEEAYFGQAWLKRHTPSLVGEQVVSVTSHGKAILILFSNEMSLYSHNQLYGRWYISRRGNLPKTTRVLRVALHTQSHSALLYSASDIKWLDCADVTAHPYLAKLGPEALDSNVHWRDIAAQILESRFQRRSLASLYLDQSFIAGIGNYLRSEILHAAKLSPHAKPQNLHRKHIGALARATLNITRLAYETAGVTNDPQRVKRLQKQGLKRSAYRFAVFSRSGLPCYSCSTPITRITASSRRLYLCAQ